MLTALEVRDILIIDRLDLAFRPGLNVLTGETGAGKSILLDALGLVLGWKGRADIVRGGATQGEVTAVFDLFPGHPARAVLTEAGIEAGDELILRRVSTADGRRTAWANDRRVGAEVLKAIGGTLVELQGQQDDGGLLNPRGHRALLDLFAGLDVSTCRALWRDRQRAETELAEAEASRRQSAGERDRLQAEVAELEKLAPKPGEAEALEARLRLMQSAESILNGAGAALALLAETGEPTGRGSRPPALAAIWSATRHLEDVNPRAEQRFSGAIEAMRRAAIEVEEAEHEIRAALDGISLNPEDLNRAQSRLHALQTAAKTRGIAPADLPARVVELRARLDALQDGGAGLDRLRRACATAEAAWTAEADRLSAARGAAATRLDAAIAEELGPLKMDRARFETRLDAADPGPEGRDGVTFTVATNPGAPSGPLNRIASGGELSRFLLALKLCLTRDTAGLTLIFDEIDRGVGGATADAVGRRLQRLAEAGQIIVVTHSPQVAARGGHHWRVEKQVRDGMTLSRVAPLTPDGRVEEIARMLAGDTVTPAAREAARALLDA